jgi:hypothetical protein
MKFRLFENLFKIWLKNDSFIFQICLKIAYFK